MSENVRLHLSSLTRSNSCVMKLRYTCFVTSRTTYFLIMLSIFEAWIQYVFFPSISNCDGIVSANKTTILKNLIRSSSVRCACLSRLVLCMSWWCRVNISARYFLALHAMMFLRCRLIIFVALLNASCCPSNFTQNQHSTASTRFAGVPEMTKSPHCREHECLLALMCL